MPVIFYFSDCTGTGDLQLKTKPKHGSMNKLKIRAIAILIKKLIF